MTELEKKAYAYATDRQKDPNYPTYNWETEISDAYEQGYKDAIEKAYRWLLEQMFELNEFGEIYVADGDASSIKEFLDNFKKAMEGEQ